MPAATVTLFYEDAPAEFECQEHDSVESAAQAIEQGERVLVPTAEIAVEVLMALGVSREDARWRVLG